MKTPQRAWPLWGLANLATIVLAPLYANWILRVTHAPGALGPNWSTNADSPGVPIGQMVILVAIALPIINLALWIALRHYPGAVEALPRLRSQGRHLLVEVVTIGLAAVLAFVLLDSTIALDWEFLPPALVWLYVVVNVRGILHAKVEDHKGRSLQAA